MESLKGQFVNLVLNVSEGYGFGFLLKSQLKIFARLNTLEANSDYVESCPSPRFKCNLSWLFDKKDLRSLRSRNVPCKIEVWVKERTNRVWKLGFAVYSTRYAQIIPQFHNQSLCFHWVKLCGVTTRTWTPEIYIALSIQYPQHMELERSLAVTEHEKKELNNYRQPIPIYVENDHLVEIGDALKCTGVVDISIRKMAIQNLNSKKISGQTHIYKVSDHKEECCSQNESMQDRIYTKLKKLEDILERLKTESHALTEDIRIDKNILQQDMYKVKEDGGDNICGKHSSVNLNLEDEINKENICSNAQKCENQKQQEIGNNNSYNKPQTEKFMDYRTDTDRSIGKTEVAVQTEKHYPKNVRIKYPGHVPYISNPSVIKRTCHRCKLYFEVSSGTQVRKNNTVVFICKDCHIQKFKQKITKQRKAHLLCIDKINKEMESISTQFESIKRNTCLNKRQVTILISEQHELLRKITNLKEQLRKTIHEQNIVKEEYNNFPLHMLEKVEHQMKEDRMEIEKIHETLKKIENVAFEDNPDSPSVGMKLLKKVTHQIKCIKNDRDILFKQGYKSDNPHIKHLNEAIIKLSKERTSLTTLMNK